MALQMKNRQIAARVGTEGTWSASVLSATHADLQIYDAKISYEIGREQRNPMGGGGGSKASTPGARIGVLTFGMDVRGAGTAGDVPPYGRLLRACGCSETVNSGSAVIGSVVAHPKNFAPTNVPVVAGTYAGTLNGTLVLTITAVAASSVTVRAEFFPLGGSSDDYETENATQTDNDEETLGGTQLSGVTVDVGDVADINMTGVYELGDRFYIRLTSDQSVEVAYATANPVNAPVLDMALYADGVIHKLHSCRGTVKMTHPFGATAKFEFEFRGVPHEIVDGALLTGIAFPAIAPPPFLGVTASLHGLALANPCFTSMEIDFSNTLAAQQCAAATTGHRAVRITNREMTGTIDPEGALVATKNWYAAAFAGTAAALSALWGSVSGNILQIAAPQVQVTGVEDADRDGIAVENLQLQFAEPEFDEGGVYSEFTLTVK